MTRLNSTLKPTYPPPARYKIHFDRPKTGNVPRRYLLRLINTAFNTNFVFSIDNHILQVISTDFVPIRPYVTYGVTIAIGQRYNMIVEASEWNSGNSDYWIRTYTPVTCQNRVYPSSEDTTALSTYMLSGILRYNKTSTKDPTTTPWPDVTNRPCEDEPSSSLKPIVERIVGTASNGVRGESFDTMYVEKGSYPLARFAMKPNPSTNYYNFQINYSDPILLKFELPPHEWNPNWVVVPEDYTDDNWVRIGFSLIIATSEMFKGAAKSKICRCTSSSTNHQPPGNPTLAIRAAHFLHSNIQ